MDGRTIKAAAIQMSSTPEKEENFASAELLIREAASAGAELVALPELWSCHGLEKAYRPNAERIPGPTTNFLGGLARELGLWVLGGSILEGEVGGAGGERLFNTSTFFDPSGEMVAVYRKIHLFDVKAPDRDYKESGLIAPGREVVTAKAGAAIIGLSVCYDLRFPELYRLLALRGAGILAVPAAFTLQTGKDHWELLLRARRREPGVRDRACPVGPEGRRALDLRAQHDRRPVGHGPQCLSRPRRMRPRNPGSPLPRPLASELPRPRQPPSRSLQLITKTNASRPSAPDQTKTPIIARTTTETATGASTARATSPSRPARPTAVAANTTLCGASMLA